MEILTTGDSASAMPARTHRGDTINLFEPGQASLLMFVPAAFTPVCGGEVDELSQLGPLANSLGVRLLVASCDTPATLRAWLADIDGAGALIGVSDHWPHGEIARHFDAFDAQAGTAVRRSYAITGRGLTELVAESPAGVSRQQAHHERGVRRAARVPNSPVKPH